MALYRFDEIAINCTAKRMPKDGDQELYIGLEHLDAGSLRVNRWGSAVPIKGEKLIMQKGDVLFGKRNAYLRRAAIAPHDGIFSAHGMVLQPKEEVIDKEFFPLFIASDYFFNEAIRISVGSLSPTVNWKDLRECTFELPSLEDQKKLAKVLWAANKSIESYKKLLKMTDELVKSQFIEMFEKCDRVAHGGYIEQVRGVSYKPSDLSLELDASHITLLRANNIDGQKIIFDDLQFVSRDKVMPQQIIKKGDILLCGSSGSLEHVGKAAIFNENGEFTFGAFCKLIRTTGELKPQFIAAFMNSKEYRDKIKEIACGTNINNLRNEHIDDLMIPYPEADAQEAFIAFKVQSDKSKFELEQSLAELTATYKRIISENLG